jgi:hypothetical protein
MPLLRPTRSQLSNDLVLAYEVVFTPAEPATAAFNVLFDVLS